jgi:putative ABC transport system substrate-binding protein
LRHIGFLVHSGRPAFDELRRGLIAYGHVGGQTIRIHYRRSEGDQARLPNLANELIDIPVELIIAVGSPPVLAAKRATSTVPILMVEIADAVVYGVVPSLVRPGGNVTGLSNSLLNEYAPRSVRLFKEIMPGASRLAILAPTIGLAADAWVKSIEGAAHALEMVTTVYHASNPDDLRRVFAGIDPRTDVLVVAPPHDLLDPATILAATMDLKIPVICQWPEYVHDGALLSSYPDRAEIYRRLAYYVDSILKGAQPSALPIEEPTKSWLMINLRTARTLAIEIPGPILMRADQVIE